MSRGRNATLCRVLSLLYLLEQRGRWTLPTLARRFGVCVRTVRRDLYALGDAGYPIAHEVPHGITRDRGRWWMA